MSYPQPLLEISEASEVFPGTSQSPLSVWELLIFVLLPQEAVFIIPVSLVASTGPGARQTLGDRWMESIIIILN